MNCQPLSPSGKDEDKTLELIIKGIKLYKSDQTAAFDYFNRAAALGSIRAKSIVAGMLIDGRGVKTDPQKALQILSEIPWDMENYRAFVAPNLCHLARRLSAPCAGFEQRIRRFAFEFYPADTVDS